MLTMGLIFFFGESIRYFIENQLAIVIGLGTAALIAAAAFYKLGIPFIEEKWLV